MTDPVHIVVSGPPGQIVLARLMADRLDALEIEPTLTDPNAEGSASDLRIGDVILGRIIRVLKGAQGALLDLGAWGTGFLPLGRPPLARAGSAAAWTTGRTPHEGLDVLAQVSRLSVGGSAVGEGGKGPRLRAAIELPGRFGIYRPAGGKGPRLRAARQMPDAVARPMLATLEPLLAESDGFILRSAAAGADPDRVHAEARALRDAWVEILVRTDRQAPPARLWRDGPALTRILREWLPPTGGTISVDRPALGRLVQQVADGFGLGAGAVTLDRLAPGTSALSAFGIEAEIEALMHRRVPLTGGGSLAIDATEALTAIDVNGGPRAGLEVNLDAALEIARQIRLRDIGGLIVIDFVDLADAPARDKVVSALSHGLAADGAPIRMGRFSSFGTLELTRERTGAGPLDRWQEMCPACGGTGRAPTVEAAVLALLRAVPAPRPPASLTLIVGARIEAWIEAHGTAWRHAFEALGRSPPRVRSDPDLPPLGWQFDETGIDPSPDIATETDKDLRP